MSDDVVLALSGDRAAIESLTRRLLPRVYGLCLRLLRHRGDLAEEATQETFARVLRALPQLREPERLVPWVLTIAANTARELGRKRPREVELKHEPAVIDVARDHERTRREKAVEQALGRLEEDERELFLLHVVEKVGLDELARAAEVSEPAIRSRVHRIRARVRGLALAEFDRAGGSP